MQKRKELNEVYILRGVAALMVCFYHLVLGNPSLFPSDYLIEKTFSYGYLGVEVFFILSGYVICYSLPDDFSFRHLGTFFLKRVTRIEPPYVVSIVLVLALNYVSHKYTGLPNQVDIFALACHLAYINNFIPDTYVNVVYWTLGIEAQFYLLIGLLFPVMKNSKTLLLSLLVVFLLISCIQIPGAVKVILPFLAYFALGISLFFFKIKKKIGLVLFMVLVAAACIQLYVFQGTPGATTAIITVLVLLFWNYANKMIKFFSMISYSLYLIHVPVGGKVVNLGIRYVESDFARYLVFLSALAVSIGAAFLFYKLVEEPTFRLSKRIRYKKYSPLSAASVKPDLNQAEDELNIGAPVISTSQI